MAVQNKTTTVVGSSTVLASVTLYPQADGSVILEATGATVDNLGNPVTLAPARIRVSGLAVIDNLCAAALSKLRIANGLEV